LLSTDKIFAFFLKDFKNQYRFKITLASNVLNPFLQVIGLILAYSAVFLVGKVESVGYVNQANYVLYLITGFCSYSFARTTWGQTSLLVEKWYLTLDGVLLCPVSRFYIFLGKAVSGAISAALGAAPYSVLIILLHPKVYSFTHLLLGLVSMGCLFSIFISLDFLTSAVELHQEGVAKLVRSYAPRAVLLLGCVYYPISLLPSFLRYLVLLNPVYHSVEIFRSAFIRSEPVCLGYSMCYLLGLSVLLPFVSVKVFVWTFRRYGVRGY